MHTIVMPVLKSPDIWALTRLDGPRDQLNYVTFQVVPSEHASPSRTLDDTYDVRIERVQEGAGSLLVMLGTAFTVYGERECLIKINEHTGTGIMALSG